MTTVTSISLAPSIAQVGSGEFTYQANTAWCQLPLGWELKEVTAVATDSQDRVLVFNRSEHPVLVFDRDGAFLSSWGEGVFARPHGIHVGPDDAIYCTDDLDHTVRKFSSDGKLLMTLGTSGSPSETGAFSVDYRNIQQAGPPFNFPTNVALSPDGEIYVTDGYGNARVHKFSVDGKLLFSWGEAGSGAGEFRVPHGIAVDQAGTVFVADRENSRIQLFSPTGEFIDVWNDIARPCDLIFDRAGNLFVAELGYRAGMFAGDEPPMTNPTGGRVSVFSGGGQLLARWGGGDQPCAPGDFFAPHDIWIDSRGDLYVSEVTYTAGIARGVIGTDCHTLQKFSRTNGKS
jgi:DNA-binding beta-propeller fold protein YncE